MSNQIVVHRGRTNIVMIDLGMDVTADTFTSQIRSKTDVDSTLIATWTVDKESPTLGLLRLTLDDAVTGPINANSGYMDLKRIVGGEPLSVFNSPVEVLFKGVVTS